MNYVKNVGVILAAGVGSRFQSDKPKQFILINNREIISYSIEEFKNVKNMDDFIVILGKNEVLEGKVAKKYSVTTVAGGSTRAESFYNALLYVKEHFPECEKIIFHEAARPLVEADVFEYYFNLLDEFDYVETCKHITDSLGSYLSEIPKRDDYYLIQAPEAYRFDLLIKYFDVTSDIYYAAHQLPKTCKGYKFFDLKHNIKLTYPEDVGLVNYYLMGKYQN